LLRNRFYIGEVVYRGEVCPGEHAPILDRALFEAVQEKLAAQRPRFVTRRAGSAALLIGKLYDERGHRMTPSHARKAGRRYRYYISSALSQGRPEATGSVARVAAETIEALVVKALRQRFSERVEADDRALVLDCVEQVVIRDRVVEIALTEDDRKEIERGETGSLDQHERSVAPTVIRVEWAPSPKRRRREIILPAHGDLRDHRPIRAETRATLVRAIALGRRWLDEITTGRVSGPAEIAARESCNVRQVTRTISLAFLAPDLVKAAVEGRLPRGIGLIRLADPPLVWSQQRELLGVGPARAVQSNSL
jgi:hypothetical protein